jgi:uncharacterized protein (TIGR00288 family)
VDIVYLRDENRNLNYLSEPIQKPSGDSRLAVFIDAENTPHSMTDEIMVACASFGRAIIMRAYGDWGLQGLVPWRDVFKEYPITAIQQFHIVSGKNSSDSAMNIDAMDVVHQKRVDTFVLVTSDSDFTRLAMRAREEGLRVIGIGRKTAPRSFVNACEQFLYLENLGPQQAKEEQPSRRSAPNSRTPVVKEKDLSAGRELLMKAAQAWQSEDGLITGGELGFLLLRLDPGFSPRNYGVRQLAGFVAMYPDVVVATGEYMGTLDPIYKFQRPPDSGPKPT